MVIYAALYFIAVCCLKIYIGTQDTYMYPSARAGRLYVCTVRIYMSSVVLRINATYMGEIHLEMNIRCHKPLHHEIGGTMGGFVPLTRTSQTLRGCLTGLPCRNGGISK